jgi:membrane associated rhomboid family serine protease
VFFFFLPLGTTRPHWRMPWVTYGLIIINMLVMTYALWDPEVRLSGFIPAHPSMVAWVESAFLHVGPGHVVGNMLFLWLFGTLVEDTLGPWMFLGIYFAGHAGATLLDWGVTATFSPASLQIPRIGASGAIAGVMGLSAVCFLRTRVRCVYAAVVLLYWRAGIAELSAQLFLGLWVGWEILQGYLSTSAAALTGAVSVGVAHWAHVGGFAVGLTLALAMDLRKRVSRDDLVTGRARMEDSSGFFSQAGELQRVVADSPEDAAAWYALGQSQEVAGRTQQAAEAYQKALLAFLRQRQAVRAAETYVALSTYQRPEALPPEILFDLGCALDDGSRFEESYDLFRLAAATQRGTRTAETALIRAGETARRFLHDRTKAGAAYWELLREYPFSDWRGLAMDGLRSLGLPEQPPPPRPLISPADDSGLRPMEGE